MTVGQIADKNASRYVKDIDKVSEKLYGILINVLAENTNSGNIEFDTDRLARLEQIIVQSLIDAGYSTSTDDYLKSFGLIEEFNDKYYSKENIKIVTQSELITTFNEKVLDQLRKNGLLNNIIKPLETIFRESAIYNRTFKEANQLLQRALIDKPILSRHVSTLAYDYLHQFDGVLNDEVKRRYDLKYFYYVGSIVEDSRPICDHIRDNFGTRAVSTDQLKVILDTFCPNGIPSDVKITYQTVSGENKTSKRGAGMIEGTILENFSEKRGGHRCGHSVKWTRRP